jgi:hypothetical protein
LRAHDRLIDLTETAQEGPFFLAATGGIHHPLRALWGRVLRLDRAGVGDLSGIPAPALRVEAHPPGANA